MDGFTFGGNFSTSTGNNTFRRVSISETGNVTPAFVDNLTVKIIGVGVDGDYNDNGTVDSADYVIWRKGVQPLQNEVATIGTTDEQDYTAWRERFGNMSGSGSGLAVGAVPEPASALLALLAGLATIALRRPNRGLSFTLSNPNTNH